MGSWRIMCSREEKIRANYEKEFWVKKKKIKKRENGLERIRNV